MASIPPTPNTTRITAATKLGELQRLVRDRGVAGGRGRMVRSIQQSMRVEGYDVSEPVIHAALDRVLGDVSRR